MEDQKFQFIEEQVKPNKKRIIKEWVKKIAILIISGIIFGLSAFAVLVLLFGKVFNNYTNNQAMPSPAATAETQKNQKPSPKPIVQKKKNNSGNMTIYNLSEMYSSVAEFCDMYEDTIVTVAKITEEKDMFEETLINSDSFCGLVISVDNDKVYVLTEYDGLKEKNKYKIVFRSGDSAEAEVVGTDDETGIAVISADTEKLDTEMIDSVRTAVLGKSDQIKTGEMIIAIGNPLGNMYSSMYGAVGGLPEKKYVTDRQIRLYKTDMRYISDGSGVVMNVNGQVIGIITHRFDEEYRDVMTFIGISEIKSLINNLMKKGTQPATGVTATDISQEHYENLGVTSGIYVTNVAPESPAMAAGISIGDVILSIAGEKIESVSQYSDVIYSHNAGDVLPVVIYRTYSNNNHIKNLKITLKDTSL